MGTFHKKKKKKNGGGGGAVTLETPTTDTSAETPTEETPTVETPASEETPTTEEVKAEGTKPRSSYFTLRSFLFLSTLFVFSAITISIHNTVNLEQEDPYMDEIFHIPQTLKYFFGYYSDWDPKITTLPGTYVVANAVFHMWNFVMPVENLEDLCNVYNLRLVNVGASILNFCLIYIILGYYCPLMSIYKRLLSTVNIASFPVLYFFSFLYYTDAVSTSFLLMMHVLFLGANYGNSAIAGAWAVLCRQTNIVWVFYHGANIVIQVLLIHYGDAVYLIPWEFRKLFMPARTMTRYYKGKRNFKILKNPVSKPVARSTSSSQVPSLSRIWKECGDEFIDQGYGYIFVGLLFLGFVLYNGSIVVGDKEAHKATINIPQVFYFALVFGIFTVSFMATRIKIVALQLLRNPLTVIALCVISAIVIYFNTPVHPYLLADNRHYTFYVWKRFYENVPLLRYAWIPFYIMVWSLISSATCLPRIVVYNYIFCTCVNLMPQLLLEFRYFIPAYMYARLTFKHVSWFELLLEFYIHVAFNYFTIHMFLDRPFLWGDSNEVQRFMW